MKKFIFGFLLLTFFDTFSQISLKLAANIAEPLTVDLGWLQRIVSEKWIYLSIFGNLCALLTWLSLLKFAPIGPAYAATHLEIVGVLIASYYLFGEYLTFTQVLGACFILIGISLFAWCQSRDLV